jgi:hypothetical protein
LTLNWIRKTNTETMNMIINDKNEKIMLLMISAIKNAEPFRGVARKRRITFCFLKYPKLMISADKPENVIEIDKTPANRYPNVVTGFSEKSTFFISTLSISLKLASFVFKSSARELTVEVYIAFEFCLSTSKYVVNCIF